MCHRIGLHVRQNVAVTVQRDPDLAMPQAFTGDLRMDAAREHVCSVRVSQIVEADAGQGGLPQQAASFMRDAGGIQRAGVGLRHHEVIAGKANAESKKLLRLPCAVGLQLIDHRRR